MPNSMNCPSCGNQWLAPDSASGKNAKCPSCGEIVTIPEIIHEAEAVIVAEPGPSGGLAQPSATSSPAADGQTRQPCPACGEMIVAGAKKCRFCGTIFDPKLERLQRIRPGIRIEDLRQIACYQRGVVYCILIIIAAYVACGVATGNKMQLLAIAAGLAAMIATIVTGVLAVLLAMRLYSKGKGIFMSITGIAAVVVPVLPTLWFYPKGMGIFVGLLIFIPCAGVGIVMLVVVNDTASKRLAENGIKVGFFGASMSQFSGGLAQPAAVSSPAVSSPAADGQTRQPCPACGEMIVVGAKKCRFCKTIFDPMLKLQESKTTYASNDADLSTLDWLFCILCAGIACIFGIIYAVQGKPRGMKMVKVSIATIVVCFIINVILEFIAMQLNGPNHVR